MDAELASTLIATLQSVQAELARVTASNELLAAQVKALAAKVEPVKVESRAEYRARLEPVAILAIQEIGPVREQIARATGIPVSTLRRWDRFENALRTVQGMAAVEAAEKFRPWSQDDLP